MSTKQHCIDDYVISFLVLLEKIMNISIEDSIRPSRACCLNEIKEWMDGLVGMRPTHFSALAQCCLISQSNSISKAECLLLMGHSIIITFAE